MKTRIYLLLINTISIFVIVFSLVLYYNSMLLTYDKFVKLLMTTIAIGVFSLILNYVLTIPLDKGIKNLIKHSEDIEKSNFTQVPEKGTYEIKALAKQFNSMSRSLEKNFEQLKSSEEARKNLIANISHDLRTPLASIQSFVEALQDGIIKDSDTFQKYLKSIVLETRQLSDLIEDLFQSTRLEANAETVNKEQFHFDSLLIECLQSMHILLEEKRINIITDLPNKLPRVFAKESHIKRVISNILKNAITFSEPNGKITIVVEQINEKFLKVNISDSGRGIEEKDLPYVFDRFYRGDSSRRRVLGGAGLGLNIAKSLVELNGGEIGVKSIINIGSSFWFTVEI